MSGAPAGHTAIRFIIGSLALLFAIAFIAGILVGKVI